MSSSETRPPRPPRPHRRWPKRILLIALALLGLLLAGPIVAGPFVGRRIVSGLEEHFAAHARFDSFALRAPGTARLRDFELSDLDGAPILTVERLDVSAGVLAAALGRYRAEVRLAGFELHLRQRADGRWNVQELPRTDEAAGSGDGGDRPDQGARSAAEPPDLRAQVRLDGGRVVVHTPEGPCGLEQLELELDLASLEEAAPFTCSGRFFGPAGAAGTVRITGDLTAAADGILGAAGLRANLALAVGDVLLDALSPALALVLGASSIEGDLAGDLELALGRDLALLGDGSLVVTDLRMRGPLDTQGDTRGDTRADARGLAVGRVELTLAATRPSETTGALELRLLADDFAEAELSAGVQGSPFADSELTAELALRAEAGGLIEQLRGWVPFERDYSFEGALSAHTGLSLRTDAGELAAVTTAAAVRLSDFAARGADGRSLDLGELANASLELEAAYDLARGVFSLPRFELAAGPIAAHGSALVGGLAAGVAGADGARALTVEDSELRAEVDLGRLYASLATFVDVDDFGGSLRAHASARQEGGAVGLEAELSSHSLRLGDMRLDAAPLQVSGTLTGESGDYALTGSASCAHVAVQRADQPELRQEALELELSARLDSLAEGGEERWTLERSHLRTRTLEVSASGALSGPSSPDLVLELSSGVERLLADLGAALGLAEHRGSGEIHSTIRLQPDAQRTRIEGDARVTGLVFELPPPASRRLEEPELTLEWSAAWQAGPDGNGELDLERAELRSSFVEASADGKLSGVGGEAALGFERLEGQLTYVPDKLGVLLEPWLPGRLSGAEREECSFTLAGPAEGVDPMGLLGGAQGSARFGLGLFETTGLATDGQVELTVADGRAGLRGELGANGGVLTFVGDLAASGGASGAGAGAGTGAGTGTGSSLVVEIKGVKANSAMSPLLERVHPAFASFDEISGGELSGLLSGAIELHYDAPLSPELLRGGWEALPKSPVSGHGSLSIDGAALRGSPLFGEILKELGVDASESLDLDPVRFRIAAGRLVYEDPWTWTVDGSRTTFTGSIGLDQSLDMSWNVPITAKLVDRHGILEALEGETVSIPITGSARRPRIAFQGVLAGLAQRTLQKELSDKLDLGKLLGVGPAEKEDERPAGPSAQELLSEANRLWKRGKKRAAVGIYERLLSEFADSEVVLRHREAIAAKIRRGED